MNDIFKHCPFQPDERLSPLTVGDDRLVPLTVGTVKLDPEPYVSRSGMRWPIPALLSGDRFNPRPEYSQNREDYQ